MGICCNLRYSAKDKLIFNFFIIKPRFLLQHYSCIISTLGGFQEQTGYSPEQPGLAPELPLFEKRLEPLLGPF